MPDVLAVTTLAPVSGFPEDAIVNNFAFSVPTLTGTVCDSLKDAIRRFYDVTGTSQAAAVSAYMSRMIRRDATTPHVIDFYDISGHLDGSPHGSPVFSRAFDIVTTNTSVPLPSEVSLALTLRGTGWSTALVETADGSDPGTELDRPRSRKTGKIYVGPFTTSALAAAATPYQGRPDSGLINDLAYAGKHLAEKVAADTSGARWCIWSRSDEFLYTITDVQVDDAWDTQRRRGPDATTRTTLSTGF